MPCQFTSHWLSMSSCDITRLISTALRAIRCSQPPTFETPSSSNRVYQHYPRVFTFASPHTKTVFRDKHLHSPSFDLSYSTEKTCAKKTSFTIHAAATPSPTTITASAGATARNAPFWRRRLWYSPTTGAGGPVPGDVGYDMVARVKRASLTTIWLATRSGS